MARQPRLTVTLKLTPGKDDDLIRWWLEQPVGERQRRIKALLRAQLDAEYIAAQRHHDDVAWIREALADLPSYLEHVLRSEQPPPGHSEGPAHLSAAEKERRARRIARTSW